jgi:hypothetical protein
MTELAALSPAAVGEVDAAAAAAATTQLLPVAAVLGELVDPPSLAALADDDPATSRCGRPRSANQERMTNDGEQLDAARRRALTLADLGLDSANLAALNQRLTDDYSVEAFGFAQFSRLDNPQATAIASDQLLSSADAITLNLIEARLHERAFMAIVGPNGRTMPDPERPEEDLAV